ncbi:uncharacterized protein LOC112271065 [Brachypodium distachyon]|uniref:Uncharacterized protein n=1 Tax=Brachypodium distachyon TaxID=15368 RepID=A0A2K2DGH1_BRADI|nr:uncharacterized protein LOC112271065 [Brachypodium distachyon]PNT73370.1 hypothetical protein BRADI_2g57562v3 [Brachypodium distachyon]|eukprot:XP_024315739.1 uncharacterized protein LOC112271065 [Brachypodium distachyon]
MEDAKVCKMEEGQQQREAAIQVPLIKRPRRQPSYPPRRKLTPFTKYFLRGFGVTLGIILTFGVIVLKGPDPYPWIKIFAWPLTMIGPVGFFGMTYADSSDDES